MGKVGVHKIFYGTIMTVVGWHVMGVFWAHRIFHEASISAVTWHGYGLGRGLQDTFDISQSQHFCGWLARLRSRSGPIRCSTEPDFLWLAGKVMAEVGAHKVFHGASITLVGWHGYGRGLGP